MGGAQQEAKEALWFPIFAANVKPKCVFVFFLNKIKKTRNMVSQLVLLAMCCLDNVLVST